MSQTRKVNTEDGINSLTSKLVAIKKSKTVAKRYKCDQCDFRGRYRGDLSRHTIVHTDEKPFPCTFRGCSYRTAWKDTLKRHSVVHVTNREKLLIHHCDQCDYRATTNAMLTQHKEIHLDSKPHACDYPSCDFRTRRRRALENHKKMKHKRDWKETEVYSCGQCAYTSKHKYTLGYHIKTHTNDKPFACELSGCDYRSRSGWNLTLHVRRYHDPSEAFFLSCNFPGCAYKTIRKSELTIHVETHNPNRKTSFVCSLCCRSFHTQSSLRNHIAGKHTGEECYSCELCKFRSKHAYALKKHMKQSHASEEEKCFKKIKPRKKYKCGFCSYRAVFQSMLSDHVRIHTGEKPFACSICSFRTSHKSDLKKHVEKLHGPPRQKKIEFSVCKARSVTLESMKSHMRIQHSGKSFRCQFCDFSTNDKKSLDSHLRKKHCSEKDATHLQEAPISPETKEASPRLMNERDTDMSSVKTANKDCSLCQKNLCNLLSPDHNNAALLNSVSHKTLAVSLERIVIC